MTTFPNDFDYAYNGTLNESIVEALLTLDCIRKGGNVALVGGAGTGKSVIADALRTRAEASGLSSAYLSSPPIFHSESQLGPAISAGILVVDEFDCWLRHQPQFILWVLALRGRSKLSTIVNIRAESLEHRFSTKINEPGAFSGGPLMALDCVKSVAEAYNVLGLWLDRQNMNPAILDRMNVPADFGAQSLVELYGIHPMQWLEPGLAHSVLAYRLLESVRAWTVLNLGTKSYRPVLIARGGR